VKRQLKEQMLRRLNNVYAEPGPREKRLLKRLKAKFRRTIEDAWCEPLIAGVLEKSADRRRPIRSRE
jgi:hypothetical protein